MDVDRELTRAARKAALLNEAGLRLVASLDVGATAQALARVVVPRLGRGCAVDVLSADGELERLAVIHDDPAVERAIWDEQHRLAGRTSGNGAAGARLDGGPPCDHHR